MEKLKMMLLSMILKKYALGYLVKGWSGVKGYKTQILAVIGFGVYAVEKLGYIPKEIAEQLYPYLLGGGAITFMQKLQHYEPIVNKTISLVKEEVKNTEVKK